MCAWQVAAFESDQFYPRSGIPEYLRLLAKPLVDDIMQGDPYAKYEFGHHTPGESSSARRVLQVHSRHGVNSTAHALTGLASTSRFAVTAVVAVCVLLLRGAAARP
jgi:hypothetical protein